MDQHRNEHSHRDIDNDSAVLSGTAALQEKTRDKRPHLTPPYKLKIISPPPAHKQYTHLHFDLFLHIIIVIVFTK